MLFEAKGRVVEVREPGEYEHELIVDIGTFDKPQEILCGAFISKNGKDFLPAWVKPGDKIEFKFKPRTIRGTSKKTGKPYAITRIDIRDIELAEEEEAAVAKDAPSLQSAAELSDDEELPF